MEDVGIFCGHLVNFTAIWYILWPFDIFSTGLVYFSPFRYFAPGKNLLALLYPDGKIQTSKRV
jgi:hypothetical protein